MRRMTEQTAWRIVTVAMVIALVILALMCRYESLEAFIPAVAVLVWVSLLNVLRVWWAERKQAQRQDEAKVRAMGPPA